MLRVGAANNNNAHYITYVITISYEYILILYITNTGGTYTQSDAGNDQFWMRIKQNNELDSFRRRQYGRSYRHSH